jgi:hypothetical protein
MFVQQRKRHRLSDQVTQAPRHSDAPSGDDRTVRARTESYSAPQQTEPRVAAAPSSSLPFSAADVSGGFTAAAGRARDSCSPVTAIVISSNQAHSTMGFSATSTASAIPATADTKRAYQCRFCDMHLSSSSNRLRHERAKHHDQLQGQEPESSAAQPSGSAAAAAAGAFETSCSFNSASAAPPMVHLIHSAAELSTRDDPCADVRLELPTASSSEPFANADLDMEDDGSISSCSDSPQNHAAAAFTDELAATAEAQPGAEAAPDSELSSPAAAAQSDDAGLTVQQPAPTIDLAGVEGVSPSLQEAELQAQCYPFLCWLTEPPLTPCEALVKARRIKSLSQLQPVKNTLRFIFVLLYESGALKVPKLAVLSTLSVCQQLYGAMQARQAGHARLHAIFLLIKKILVFLSSQESAARRQFLLPSSVSESYLYVDGICSDSSFRRKQEARNRSLLGVAASRQLHRTQAAAAALVQSSAAAGDGGPAHHAGGGFRVPQTWSTGAAPNTKLKDQSPKPRPSRGTPANAKAATTSPLASSASAQPVRAQAASSSPAAAAAVSAVPSTAELSANEMSSVELQQVTQGCVQFLQQHSYSAPAQTTSMALVAAAELSDSEPVSAAGKPSPSRADVLAAAAIASNAEPMQVCAQPPGELTQMAPSQFTPAAAAVVAHSAGAVEPHIQQQVAVADHVYMAYLVTAILCLCMAPRSQALRQLQIGSSLVKEADGKYWVRLLANMCKNGKPTLFAVPELLTPAIDHYLQDVRPRMLARQSHMPSAAAAAAAVPERQAHDYFFCKTNGTAPRTEFSTCSSLVTMQLIGRPINAHAFRSAVITTFYSTNASQADMDTLANIMSHDATTARNYYYRPAHMRAAEDTAQRMMQQLLPAAASEQNLPAARAAASS